MKNASSMCWSYTLQIKNAQDRQRCSTGIVLVSGLRNSNKRKPRWLFSIPYAAIACHVTLGGPRVWAAPLL